MHYSELRIYQIAKKLEEEIEQEIKKIPYYWKIEDIDQLRRSSSSTTSNIVEGHGRRFYLKDYIKFLNYSLSSSDESQKHIGKLYKIDCFNESVNNYFAKGYKDLSIKILNYINWLRKNPY